MNTTSTPPKISQSPLTRTLLRRSITPLAALSLALAATAPSHAASGSWTGLSDSTWANTGNWDISPVPGTGDTATFNSAGNGNTTLDLGAGVTVSNIIFDAGTVSYTIGSGAVGSQTLSLDNAGSLRLLGGVANNQTVNANLSLSSAANGSATITNGSSSLLTIAGGIIGNAASGNGVLTVIGNGNVVLVGPVTKPGAGNVALFKRGPGQTTISSNGFWSGTGASSGGFSGPLIAQEGTLMFNNGGSNFVKGEIVIGGVVANGGAGQNARIVVNGSRLAIDSWFSIGRGNGVGGVLSELIATNGATVTASNISAGFNGGNAANLPKGSLTLKDTSTFTILGNGAVNFAESAGSDMTMTLSNSAQFIALGTAQKHLGQFGRGTVNIYDNSAILFGNGLANIGYRSGTGVVNLVSGTLRNDGELRVGGSDTSGTGNNGYGTLNMSGGVANLGGFVVGRGNNNQNGISGEANLTGGVLTSTNDIVIGYAGLNNFGKVTINGAMVNVGPAATKWVQVGVWDTTRGELNIVSGSLNLLNNTAIKMNSQGTIGSNVVNQTGGNVTSYSDAGVTVGGSGDLDLQRAGSASSINTYNLDGGILTIPRVFSTQTTGTRTFNFNGGTLRAAVTNASFFNLGSGNAVANVRGGGAIVDSNGKDITIAQALAHSNIGTDPAVDGGLTKIGAGTLTLSGNNSYTGPTKVLGGTLILNAAQMGSGSGLVVSNATLNLGLNGSTLYTGDVAFGGTSVLNLSYGTFSGFPTAIQGGGSIAASGSTVINITGIGFGVGQYTLVKYATGSPLPNLASFTLGTLPSGITATLSNNVSNLSLDLVISSAGQLLSWHGANADNTVTLPNWDINTSANWYDPAFSTLLKYLQYAGNTIGDNVVFGDNGFNTDGTNQVTLNTTVVPATVTFSAASQHYRINGTGSIGGGTSVVLTNNATSVVLGTANTYTGGTVVGGGSLIVSSDNALGASSGGVNLAGGALQLNGTASSSRAISVTANSSVGVASGFTPVFSGVISGSGALTKTDAGKLTLTANNNFSGSTIIKSGTFAVSAGISGHTNADVQISPEFSDDGVLEVSGGVLNANRVIIGGNSANSGSPGAGVVNQTGGTINSRQWFTVGSGVNAGSSGSGIYNFSGGTLNIWSQQMEVGNFTATDGTVNMSGTAALNIWNNQFLTLGANNGGNSGTFNQNAGTVTLYSDAGVTPGGTGALYIGRAGTSSGTFTYNLNGGTLIVPQVQGNTANTATRVFNFNGGTLRASKANTTFMFGLTSANVQSGGAIIDSSSNNITISQALLDGGTGGGLTKLGTGTLTLTGANTYTGATLVNEGSLMLAPAHQSGGAVTVANGAKFGVANAAASGGALIGNLNLGSGGATTLDVSYSMVGNPTGEALTAGAVTINGTATLRVSGAFAVGAFPVLKYSSLSGSFASVSVPRGVSATLSNDIVNKTYYVVVSSIGGGIVWTGNTGLIPNLWDINLTTNWITGSDLTTYQQTVAPGDAVLFNNTGSGTVLLSNTISPLAVTFSNSTVNYTVNGTGQIVSFAGLTKRGIGSVDVNVQGTYLGSTVVSNGTLNLGANQVVANLTGDGTISTVSGTPTLTVTNTSATAFAGAITGGLSLTKNGNATLNLSGANTYSGATVVSKGTLAVSGQVNSTAAVSSVGNTSGSQATLDVIGTFGANYNPANVWNSSIDVGVTAGASGVLRMTNASSVLTVAKQISLGYRGYGLFSQTAGMTTIGGFIAAGGNTNGAVFEQSGGTVTLNGASATLGYDQTTSKAVMNLSGNAVFNVTGAGNGVWPGEVGTGTLNMMNNASLNITNSGVVLGKGNAAGVGTFNLNGGTATLNSVSKGTGTGYLNLNGGTLKANAASTTFISGLNAATLYGNGARIDDGGFDIAIGQDIASATGDGVASISVDSPGAGYVGAPIVTITGGSGTGASAIAQINPVTGTVTGIVITCPGSGYVNGDFLSITLDGGGATTSATAGATVTFAPNSNGNLVKVGSGTVALNGNNTYGGSTVVSNGTLAGIGTITGPVVVRSGAALAPGNNGIGTLTVGSTPTFQGSVVMQLDRNGGSPINDLLEAGSAPLVYGGTLVVTNVGVDLQVGDSFKLFNTSGGYSGSFTVVSQTPNQVITWNTSALTTSGTISVAAIGSPLANYPTNVTVSISGGNMNIGWPETHRGWILQTQTNSLSVGLANNWFDVAGTSANTNAVVPISPANPAVFFRLRHP